MSTNVSNGAAASPSEVEPQGAGRPERGLVLLAEADRGERDRVAALLEAHGHEVLAAEDGRQALSLLDAQDCDLALISADDLPRVGGLSVLAALPAVNTRARVVIMARAGPVERVVEAMRLGAYDFVETPVDTERILDLVTRALEERRLRDEGAPHSDAPSAIIGRSGVMRSVFRLIERVADTRATVVVTGETGTGKELVARAVHDFSGRADEPFVAVNCSAIPSALLEAELFGHARGSFTGAVQNRKGLIEEADGGTLFLDEISTLSQDVQVKLLRVLEDRRVQRIGRNTSVEVDFRLVAATNTELAPLVESGDFREDLFFRLDVFPIRVPPLRERREDIPLLADHFLRRCSEEHGIEPPRLSARTLARLRAYDWPGNVRELENFIERSLIMYPGRGELAFELPKRSGGEAAKLLDAAGAGEWTLARLEREYLLSALERNRWRYGATAAVLGISRRTIHRKLGRYREEGLLAEERPD